MYATGVVLNKWKLAEIGLLFSSLGLEQYVVGVDPSAGFFKKIRLAEPYFRLISGLAEFLRKLRNSAENTPEHYKFGQQDSQIETAKFKI